MENGRIDKENRGLVVDYYYNECLGGVQSMAQLMAKEFDLKPTSYFDVAKALNIPLNPNQYSWFEFQASGLFSKYLSQYEHLFRPPLFIINSIIGIFEPLKTPYISIIQDNEFGAKQLYESGYYDIHTFLRFYHGFRTLQEKNFEQSKKIVVLCKQAERDYKAAYPQYADKFVLCHNGINTDFWKPLNKKSELREKYGIPQDKVVAIFNGSTHPIKGWHIMADMIKHYKDIFFVCIFKHPLTQETYSENVKAFSMIDSQTVLELNNCSDFAIQPSQIENDSCALAQAQSCDLPLITTRVGYYWDCLSGENDFGYTVSKWDSESFKEAMDGMLKDLNNKRKFYSRDLIFSEKRDMISWKERWQKIIVETCGISCQN